MSKSISLNVALIQCQIEILKATILAEELVEHRADWLKNAKTVVRDKTGRFASKAASIKEDAQSVIKTGGDILNISADAISQMVKDPGFRERAGLSASAMMGKAIGNLVAQAKIFPGLEKQIDKFIAQQEKKLQNIYGKDNNALNQAFEKVKLPQPPKDASFREKLEFQAVRYKTYEETLKNPHRRTTLDDVAAAGKAAVPVAVSIGLNLAVDLGVPLLLGNPLSLVALMNVSLISYAASEGASAIAKNLMDKTELSDTQKMIADIAVRILAGGAVTGVASKVEGKAAKELVEKFDIIERLVVFSKNQFKEKTKSIESKASAVAIKSLENPLPPIRNAVTVKATQSVDSGPVSISMERKERDQIFKYVRNSFVYINPLLRGEEIKEEFLLMKIGDVFGSMIDRIPLQELRKVETDVALMNEFSEEVTDTILKEIGLLCKALKRLPKIEGAKTFTRGVGEFPGWENIKPGDSFVEKGFMSCTALEEGGPFSGHRIHFVIKPKPISSARDVSRISQLPEEKEVLYPPGAKFTVESVETVNSQRKVITILED